MVDFEKLKRIFPRASKAFLQANADIKLQDPESKPVPGATLDKVISRKKKSPLRAHVCITAFTVRPRDQDNLAGGCKALLDGIKKLRLIADDDPYSIDLTVKQRHVAHFDHEKTLLEIEYR